MYEADNKGPSRRDFIKATTGIVGGLIGLVLGIPAISYLIGPALQEGDASAWEDLGELSKYPLNVPSLFQFTRTEVNGWERSGMTYGAFVVRQSETSARVFSNICTHLGCHVNWHPDLQHYVSPCHDGHFDIFGQNISGPPPRPLDEYNTKVEAGKLYILLPAFKRYA